MKPKQIPAFLFFALLAAIVGFAAPGASRAPGRLTANASAST